MFNVCYECDGELIKKKGTIYGFWGDQKIEFTGLPKYQCSYCDEFYLDEGTAILTQEITRALCDANDVPEIVDVADCYDLLTEHLDDIYDMVLRGKVHWVKVGNTLLINIKDVRSLFSGDELLLAARNKGNLTPDVEKEIAQILRKG